MAAGRGRRRIGLPGLAGVGRRGGSGWAARAASAGLAAGVVAVAVGSSVGLGLWSVASRWRFPDALPGGWTLETWARALPNLAGPAWTTLTAGLAAAGIALVLVLGCLENEQRSGLRPSARGLWLLYLPLLVPQIGFLFGTQVLLVAVGLDGTWPALVWSHLLFVLPYVFLTLADPYRALDERYARAAACLGASPARVFLRVKLPLLLRPILAAAAIGFSVSVAQYLPTQFAGAGRLPTLTTEAVGLAAGADRRLIGVYGFAQAALPWPPSPWRCWRRDCRTGAPDRDRNGGTGMRAGMRAGLGPPLGADIEHRLELDRVTLKLGGRDLFAPLSLTIQGAGSPC